MLPHQAAGFGRLSIAGLGPQGIGRQQVGELRKWQNLNAVYRLECRPLGIDDNASAQTPQVGQHSQPFAPGFCKGAAGLDLNGDKFSPAFEQEIDLSPGVCSCCPVEALVAQIAIVCV